MKDVYKDEQVKELTFRLNEQLKENHQLKAENARLKDRVAELEELKVKDGNKIVEIKTTFGGSCIYKQGVLANGTKTGKIQYTGQSKENLNHELLESVKTGRDDVRSFVDSIMS